MRFFLLSSLLLACSAAAVTERPGLPPPPSLEEDVQAAADRFIAGLIGSGVLESPAIDGEAAAVARLLFDFKNSTRSHTVSADFLLSYLRTNLSQRGTRISVFRDFSDMMPHMPDFALSVNVFETLSKEGRATRRIVTVAFEVVDIDTGEVVYALMPKVAYQWDRGILGR